MKIKKMARHLTAVVLVTGGVFCTHADSDPAASVTIDGVTTTYASLMDAWAYATNKHDQVDVYVKLLKDAKVGEPLVRTVSGFIGWTLTLDLNDRVLAYAGEDGMCFIQQKGGNALQIVDTATTRTPRYFTCDNMTGLWTLTNEVTDLTVSGGLITGGRAGAVQISYGSKTNVIRNANLVGNYSANDGGAVSVTAGTLDVTGSTFLGNVSARNGGAVASSVPCLMTDCRVEANVAGEFGGGVYMQRCGSLVRTEVVGNRAGTGGGVYLTFNVGPCFPAGVKILMADGSEKNVENIAEGDVVATFDHEGGTNSSAAVFYVYRGTEAAHVFTLLFASGTSLAIAGHHDLLLENTRKYVTISSDNARSYLGKRFYNYVTGDWDELTSVMHAKDCDTHYSLYTRGHINCVANGMLTVPDDKDCFINVYELGENLKADAERLAADIATYGLAKPADYPNIPLDDFADGNIRYAFIAIGKGLSTQEELLFWNEFDYGPIMTKKAASARKLTMTAATPKLTTATLIPRPTAPYLEVGEGAVVTGNVSAAGTDNAYLKHSVSLFGTEYNPVIDILPDATGIDVGVTHSNGAGIFGWTNTVKYAACFFADNPTYSVSYTADRVLALRTGIQVGGDAWATVKDGLCTIVGTGDMWDMSAAKNTPLWGLAITNVVVSDGVTKVGAHVFEKMATVKDVSLASSVTNLGVLAFHKCYLLSNVVSAASAATTVGDGAFLRCNSLERLHFDGEARFGREAYALQVGIRMVGGMPEVYPIPQIECDGYRQQLMGSNDLKIWNSITPAQKLDYNFFKIVMETVD